MSVQSSFPVVTLVLHRDCLSSSHSPYVEIHFCVQSKSSGPSFSRLMQLCLGGTLSIGLERWWCDAGRHFKSFRPPKFTSSSARRFLHLTTHSNCVLPPSCRSARTSRLPMASRRREPSPTRRRIRTSTRVCSRARDSPATPNTMLIRNRKPLNASARPILILQF